MFLVVVSYTHFGKDSVSGGSEFRYSKRKSDANNKKAVLVTAFFMSSTHGEGNGAVLANLRCASTSAALTSACVTR